mgnify:CR=1 FL=1
MPIANQKLLEPNAIASCLRFVPIDCGMFDAVCT